MSLSFCYTIPFVSKTRIKISSLSFLTFLFFRDILNCFPKSSQKCMIQLLWRVCKCSQCAESVDSLLIARISHPCEITSSCLTGIVLSRVLGAASICGWSRLIFARAHNDLNYAAISRDGSKSSLSTSHLMRNSFIQITGRVKPVLQ